MRFTIISAVLNGGPAFKNTVDSLLCQRHGDFEQIVQDGGSTDKSTDFLEQLADPRIRLFREKDTGIYDAWNKAVGKAEGDWAIFLGAGDMLLGPDVLTRCAACLEAAPKQTIFAYGDLFMGNLFSFR
ncbi:glycosyltransferase [Desulfovibrio sp. OttesenSCG-928-M16]|nr:glycosyltransferase [Desulfovibrio sp. OttesenSCG-928-M16]